MNLAMETESGIDIREQRGCVATVCLSGTVTPQYSTNFSNLRDYNSRNGFVNVEYKIENGVLVEAARDALVEHALHEGYKWILQIDADAAPFQPDALERMLGIVYESHPWIDALGAYCQLKAPPHFPTIDTGTGMWEEHYPGEGILTVIRTGAHFLLTKDTCFQHFGPPWFRTRKALSLSKAMKEVDSTARQRFHGDNPLTATAAWEALIHEAVSKDSKIESSVGEDSGFFDSLRFCGGSAAVDTDLVVGHVADRIITPQDFVEGKRNVERLQRMALGVWG